MEARSTQPHAAVRHALLHQADGSRSCDKSGGTVPHPQSHAAFTCVYSCLARRRGPRRENTVAGVCSGRRHVTAQLGSLVPAKLWRCTKTRETVSVGAFTEQ
jgi:hypothetical protein